MTTNPDSMKHTIAARQVKIAVIEEAIKEMEEMGETLNAANLYSRVEGIVSYQACKKYLAELNDE